MARTDDDSWDITESVGATALGVAAARAAETRGDDPLIEDPYAALFLEAAGDGPWNVYLGDRMGEADEELSARMRSLRGYAASRTKFFDDFFITAANAGVRQAVILAAGLDARAWRLPWPGGCAVYEIDQPKVLEFKRSTLDAHQAEPRGRYVAVPVDLRQDWPKALQEAGFDPAAATAWSAEGLLPYLPPDAQDLLFDRIQSLSAAGSRIAVEAFSRDFFTPENLERQRARRERYVAAAAKMGHTMPDVGQLWYLQERTDVAEWLRAQGWDVTAVTALELMARNHREPADPQDAPPSSLFVEARLV